MQSNSMTIERERLASLDRYDILDTPSEEAFDRITRLTRRVFDVPMSTLTLVDDHRQWFKSRQGVSACETARGPSFCTVAVGQRVPLLVPDAWADVRFFNSPLVLGAPHIRFYAGAPLITPEGHAIGSLCAMDTRAREFDAESVETLSDLAALAMTQLELRLVAMTDALTGAHSRRAFRSEMDRALSLAQRHGHALSCIMLDLDHFKAVNDTHGHAAGDLVLAATAGACRKALRESDSFGRMGGEEFAVLLPHTDAAHAMTVAEKLRCAIAGLRIPTASGPINVTASLGVAGLDGGAGDTDVLLHRADAALYAAKKSGRNRCVDASAIAVSPPNTRRRLPAVGPARSPARAAARPAAAQA